MLQSTAVVGEKPSVIITADKLTIVLKQLLIVFLLNVQLDQATTIITSVITQLTTVAITTAAAAILGASSGKLATKRVQIQRVIDFETAQRCGLTAVNATIAAVIVTAADAIRIKEPAATLG